MLPSALVKVIQLFEIIRVEKIPPNSQSTSGIILNLSAQELPDRRSDQMQWYPD